MFSLGTTLFELMTHRVLPGIVHENDFSDEIKLGRRPRFLPKVCFWMVSTNPYMWLPFRIQNIHLCSLSACLVAGIRITDRDLVLQKS